MNADEEEEKQRLISQVLELQNTLDGGSQAPYFEFWSFVIIFLSISLNMCFGYSKESSLEKTNVSDHIFFNFL